MKKLMIVAAAAAMIGSVEAAVGDDVVYQATYNLKTTVGKATTDSNPYKLGKDGVGVFWYQDPALDGVYWTVDSLSPLKITLIDTTNFKLVKKAGNAVPTLTSAGLKDDTIMTLLVGLAPVYNEKSANQFCLTFTYSANFCYRIAGTIKIDGYFVESECFNTTGAPDILDNFGGSTWDKSKQVELYHETFITINGPAAYNPASLVKKEKTGNFYFWATPADVRDNAKYPQDRTIVELSIAGHGTWGKVFDQNTGTREGVTQVSGYAVGAADMPMCESCCAPGIPLSGLQPWDCCGVRATAGTYANNTAVFGTFTFKYNAAETKKLY